MCDNFITKCDRTWTWRLNLEKVGPTFSHFSAMPALKITQKISWLLFPDLFDIFLITILYIENTSWKVPEYGIYARVVDASEIERVSAANE